MPQPHAADHVVEPGYRGPSYAPPVTPAEAGEPAHWGAARRAAFRFAFCYLALYAGLLPLAAIAPARVDALGTALWSPVVRWTAAHVLGVATPVATATTGSGDRLFDWIQALCTLALAIVGTVAWSVLGRRRGAHPRLFALLHAYTRYALGVVLLGYGMVKVIPTQFPAPALARYVEPYGDFSPMGVLWTFMGTSAAYTVFAGLSEVVAGLLLFARRTALLGALLAIGVMANVVMLNFAYDVPVKLFSTHLLLMALFLALPDAPRMIDALVLGRATAPVRREPLVREPRLRVALLLACAAVVAGAVLLPLRDALASREMRAAMATQPLYGLYEVEELTRDGVVVLPLVTDATRWRRVVITGPSESRALTVQAMTDSLSRWGVTVDTARRRIEGRQRDDSTRRLDLAWTSPAGAPAGEPAGELRLAGRLAGDSVTMRLRRVDPERFRVRARGFHWISEAPYNR